MKYVDTQVVFREVPDELTLAINISGCPVNCPGCHSSYLAQDIGEILDRDALDSLIDGNPGISCVAFMGGDADPLLVKELADHVHSRGLKTCWYSGRGLSCAEPVLTSLDFIKVGPYIEKYGPLDYSNTNQRFYKVDRTADGPKLTDWTGRFRKVIF